MGIIDFEAPKLYPVIHNESESGALKSVELVLAAGADGVFLINHREPFLYLVKRHRAVVAEFPDAFVGLNFLDINDPLNVFRYLNQLGLVPDAVWSDCYHLQDPMMALVREETPTDEDKRTLLFAGVAHKAASYTGDPNESAVMAKVADQYVDFVTTTGPGTGYVAPVDKVIAMRHALRHSGLAIASGITPSNVQHFVPHVDAILVASSIETQPGSGEIDPIRLEDLMVAFRSAIETERTFRELTSATS